MIVKRVAVTLNITRTTQFNMQRFAHKKMDVAQREWNKSDIGRCYLYESYWMKRLCIVADPPYRYSERMV